MKITNKEELDKFMKGCTIKVSNVEYIFWDSQPFTTEVEGSNLRAVVPCLFILLFLERHTKISKTLSVLVLIDEDTDARQLWTRIESIRNRELIAQVNAEVNAVMKN